MLGGKDAFQRAQVSQWLNFVRQETWPLAKGVSAYVFGTQTCPSEVEHTFIYNALKENCKILNKALLNKQFLVGDSMTVADL